MKVLTAAQMREVDRLTIERGIPGLILMETAGARVVEFLAERFAPLNRQRIVVLCGKGNNGGDGLVIARQLAVRHDPEALDVVLAFEPSEFDGDAAANFRMLSATGVSFSQTIDPRLQTATLVIDALLGTGLDGEPRGRALELIHQINTGFPLAKVVAVDTPSGLRGGGVRTRVHYTVTFTAPKVEQVLAPGCDAVGELIVAPIGSPADLWERDEDCWLHLTEPSEFRSWLNPRSPGGHKGDYGHVLVVGGAAGKGGAAAMSGLAALRAGAGLVTVATSPEERNTVTVLAPELMTQSWESSSAHHDVLAVGPGLGTEPQNVEMARQLFANAAQAAVFDADGLNALAGTPFEGGRTLRVLTPHPGEMARLTGESIAAIQADRLTQARNFARQRNVVLVLKGQRTLIAFPDGRVWVNPTGSPAMATAGSGDILTGLLAGFLAQYPESVGVAILAAVWLHGKAGELGAAARTEQCLIATDLLQYLPEAIGEARRIPYEV